MKNIKVLGSGCTNCVTTARLIEEIAETENVDISVEKVEDIGTIMGYGVMSTPGVVIGNKVVHAGGIPSKATIKGWLTGGESERDCCDPSTGSASGCCE